MPGSILPPWTTQLWSPGQTQPTVGGLPVIDWTNPLTRNLVSYWFPLTDGSGFIDLVTGDTTKKGTGTKNLFPTGAASPYGVGPTFAATTSLCESTSFGPIQSWSAPYSFAVGWFQRATTAITNPAYFGLADASGNDAFMIYSPSNGNMTWSYGNGGGQPTIAITNNTFNIALGVAIGATAQSNYLNGIARTAGTATSAFSGSSQRYLFGDVTADGTAGSNLNATVFFGAAWTRALDAAEASLLWSDPYSFLLPPEAELPALSPGEAPAFPPGVMPGNALETIGGRPPDFTDLNTWTWSYNLNLIGKDQLPIGVFPGNEFTNLPARQQEQIHLRSWISSYNLNLIGKDRLPTGEQLTDLPASQRVAGQLDLRSWQSNPLPLRVAPAIPPGRSVQDIPRASPDQIQIRSWLSLFNPNLIGQDHFPIGEMVFGRPALSVPVTLSWSYNATIRLPAAATTGTGAAAGSGTASGVGAATAAAVGAAAGTGAVSGAGAATAASAGSAAGSGVASGAGASTTAGNGVGTTAGSGAASGVGAATAAAVGAAAGAGVASGVAASAGADTGKIFRGHLRSLPNRGAQPRLQTWQQPLNLPLATSVTSGSAGAASGSGTASGVGAATAAAVGAAAGSGAASALSAASAGSAAGSGAASGAGRSTAAAVGSAAGSGAASGVGAATAAGVGSATGTGAASSLALGGTIGSAAGSGAASAVGRSTAASAGSAAGSGAATGVGRSTAASAGLATGTGTAAAVGAGLINFQTGAGNATGTGAASAVGRSTAASVGSAAGLGAAIGDAGSQFRRTDGGAQRGRPIVSIARRPIGIASRRGEIGPWRRAA